MAKGMGEVSNTALDQKPFLPGRTQGQNCYSRKVLSPEHRPPSTVSFPLGRTSAFQARCGISVRGRGRAVVGGERNSSRHLFRWPLGAWQVMYMHEERACIGDEPVWEAQALWKCGPRTPISFILPRPEIRILYVNSSIL